MLELIIVFICVYLFSLMCCLVYSQLEGEFDSFYKLLKDSPKIIYIPVFNTIYILSILGEYLLTELFNKISIIIAKLKKK
jgi:hypothetical protein